jgi:flavin-dependent dehydrogenase
METYEVDVCVIGAGLSGLACALYLAEKDRGLRVIVLDAKGEPCHLQLSILYF